MHSHVKDVTSQPSDHVCLLWHWLCLFGAFGTPSLDWGDDNLGSVLPLAVNLSLHYTHMLPALLLLIVKLEFHFKASRGLQMQTLKIFPAEWAKCIDYFVLQTSISESSFQVYCGFVKWVFRSEVNAK